MCTNSGLITIHSALHVHKQRPDNKPTDGADTELRSHDINLTTVPSTDKRASRRCALTVDSWQLTFDRHKAAALLTGILEGQYLFESWLRPRLPEQNSMGYFTAPKMPRQNPKYGHENSFQNLQLTLRTAHRSALHNCANVATKPTVGNKTTNCEKWPLGRSRCRGGDNIKMDLK